MFGRTIPSLVLVVSLIAYLPLGCSKDEGPPQDDPVRILSLYRWIYRYTDTVDSQKINVTISFNFGDNLRYQYKQVGLLDGDEVDDYSILETGDYEATMETITLTPDGGTQYTLSWRQVEGSGDIEITMADGRVLEYTYLPQESW